MFTYTINCGTQYKPLLATGLSCLPFLPFYFFYQITYIRLNLLKVSKCNFIYIDLVKKHL